MAIEPRIADRYRETNETCARIIAAEPERYPGLPQEWARLVLSRVAEPPADAECGPLFAGRAA